MKNEKDTYELIEKYLDNTLSGTERSAFEQQLKEDPSLVQELETHKAVHDLIIDQGLLELKQKMKTGTYEKNTNSKWKIYSITGAIVLIGISAAWFFTSKTESNTQPASIVPIKENKIAQQSTETTSIPKAIEVNKPDKSSLALPKAKDIKIQEIKQASEDPQIKTDSVSPILKEVPELTSTTVHVQKAEVPATEEPKSVTQKNQAKIVTIGKLPESKTEQKEVNNEFLFNPSLGQLWEFPIQPGDNCELKIMNRNGDVIFRANINNGYPNAWNGMTANGNEITMGTYLYFITYPDGKMDKGFVTISK